MSFLRFVLSTVLGVLFLSACQDLGPEPGSEEGMVATSPGAATYHLDPIATLGGTYGTAFGINNAGVVVGMSANAAGELRAFVSRSGALQELPGLGGNTSAAYAVNAHGWIVGEAENASSQVRAVAWIEGQAVDLGTLGGDHGQALAVNDRGQIVGMAQNAAGEYRAFLWSRKTGMQQLPLPPGAPTMVSAEGIDDSGDVVGTARMPSGWRALLWSRGQVGVLETGCTNAQALDINGRGQAVGEAWGCPISPIIGVPLVWNRGLPAQHLEPVGGLIWPLSSPQYQNSGHATSVNDRGQIAGSSSMEPDAYWMIRATLWRGDAVVNMGGEPGHGSPWRRAIAEDINDRGVAAGVSGMTPILYVPGPAPSVVAGGAVGRLDQAVLDLEADLSQAVERSALFGSRAAEAWAVRLCEQKGSVRRTPRLSDVLAGCPIESSGG